MPALYYSRSEDDGQSWTPVEELDRADERYNERYGPSYATVLTWGRDQVYVIWDAAPSGQRWHLWSSDGGRTWSLPVQISPYERGLTLPVATAFDSAGTLHIVSAGYSEQDGLPAGAVHFAWQSGRWSESQRISARADWKAEFAALAIAGGDHLVATWTDKAGPKGTAQIWASFLRVDAPAAALPSPTPVAAVTSATPKQPEPLSGAGTQEPESRSTPIAAATTASAPGPSGHLGQSGVLPALVGVLPPAVLVILILIVRRNRLRGGG